MAQTILAGDTSGTVTLQAPAVAGSTVVTLPATTGNMVVDNATQTLTNKTYTNPTFSGTASGTVIVSGAAVASTSGTSIDFTSIPSWVKRITVMFNGVSTNGTSSIRLQLGPVGGVSTSGYAGSAGAIAGASAGGIQTGAAGFDFTDGNNASATRFGVITFALCDATNNVWCVFGGYGQGNTILTAMIGGAKALTGALSILRITTVNGTDAFDAGSINILYE